MIAHTYGTIDNSKETLRLLTAMRCYGSEFAVTVK